MRYGDISGNSYNHLTAIKKENNGNWQFKCTCGNSITTRPGLVVKGNQRSCGCLSRIIRESDYIGKRFGHLTAIKQTKTYKNKKGSTNQRRAIWQFQCDCGNVVEKVLTFIKKQKNPSCGCKREANEASLIKIEYSKYKASAKSRELSFNISIEDFESIIKRNCHYCNESPKKRHSKYFNVELFSHGIDRVDSSLGYELENCVTCCKNCNYMKSDSSVQEFISQIIKVYKYQKAKNKFKTDKNSKIGDVLLDLEIVLDKMCDQGLQLGDILALVHSHIHSHRKDAVEVYTEDNSNPVMKYGHKDQI